MSFCSIDVRIYGTLPVCYNWFSRTPTFRFLCAAAEQQNSISSIRTLNRKLAFYRFHSAIVPAIETGSCVYGPAVNI